MLPRRLLDWRALLLAAAAVLAAPAQASLPGLDNLATASPAPATTLQNELPRELPGPCAGEQCGELEAPQPETRVRGFELDLYCRLGGEQGLSCRPRQVWLEEYGEGTSDRLVYAKARYFDPELGRFLSQDSYLGELTEPPSLHRYLYAEGRPTYYTDPDGHSVWSAAWKVAKTGGRVSAIWEGISADIDAMGRTDSFMDQLGLGLSMASELLPVSAHDIVDPVADYQEGSFKNMGRQALARTGVGRTAMSMERAKGGFEQIAEGEVVEGTRRIAEAAASIGQRRPGAFGMQKSKGTRPARPSGDAGVVHERQRAISDDPAPALQKERVGDDPPPGAAPSTGPDHGSGRGRRGSPETRAHIDAERDKFIDANPDYRHVRGGTDRVTGAKIPEEYLPGPGGARKGSSYPDLTFEGPDGSRIRLNTVDTDAAGNMTKREQTNFDRLFDQTEEPVIAIPKPKKPRP